MRRREFVWLLGFGVVASVPYGGRAQQTSKVYRIAIVSPASPVADMSEGGTTSFRALLGELRRLGYVEGQNLVVERYSGGGQLEHYREVVADVVRSRPDAIVASSSTLVLELKAQTTTIPIVAGGIGDPLASGIVPNLARPGGNITGTSVEGWLGISSKRLGLLKEAIPRLTRMGLLVTPTAANQRVRATLKEAADKIAISIVSSPLESPVDETAIRRAFGAMVQADAEAVYVSEAAEFFPPRPRQLIVELAEKHKLPAIYSFREHVEIGGLMAYAADVPDAWRHVADALAEILRGTEPGDIPFYQANKFHLVINLKTAKALDIEIPTSLLAQADEVIE
jgi:putative ABC transport system substrate-binding protein